MLGRVRWHASAAGRRVWEHVGGSFSFGNSLKYEDLTRKYQSCCSCSPCFVFPCHKNHLPINPLHLLLDLDGIVPDRISSSAPSSYCNSFETVKTCHFPLLFSLPCISVEEDVLCCCISYAEACLPPTIDIFCFRTTTLWMFAQILMNDHVFL